MSDIRSRRGRTPESARSSALDDLVLVVLLLAGAVEAVTGGPLHGAFLLAAAGFLLWHRGGGPAPAGASAVAEPRVPAILTLAGGLAFAVVVGRFGRFSWPATAAVVTVGAAGVRRAWRTPPPNPVPAPLDRRGAALWAVVFVALGLWELTALLMQPTLTNGSAVHPTLSVLMDSALVGPFGRTVSILAWLALGRFLVRR